MKEQTRWRRWVGLALGAALLGSAALGAGANARTEQPEGRWTPPWWSGAMAAATVARLLEIAERPVAAGTLDDGEELLPRATLTVEQAIAAARDVASGPIGEIDLEDYRGRLVFNVDVGDRDVKVDAATGEVLGAAAEE